MNTYDLNNEQLPLSPETFEALIKGENPYIINPDSEYRQ